VHCEIPSCREVEHVERFNDEVAQLPLPGAHFRAGVTRPLQKLPSSLVDRSSGIGRGIVAQQNGFGTL
jgi:hypothetical protein